MKRSLIPMAIPGRRLPWHLWVLGGLGLLTLGEVGMLWMSAPASGTASSRGGDHQQPRVEPAAQHVSDLGGDLRAPAQAESIPGRQELSTGSDSPEESIESTAIAWANTDLKKAMDWLGQIEDPALRERATLAVSNEAVRSHPVDAVNLAISLEPSPLRDDLIRRGAAEWALSDASKAKDWALQIEDETLRAGVIAGIATSWSSSDPVSSANLALDKLPEGRLQSDTLVSIVQRWGQTDPESAAAWIQRFPKGELKSAAIHNLAAIWSTRDAARAGNWETALVRGAQ